MSDSRVTSAATPIERLLRRERLVVLVCLAVLSLLAWITLLAGAGTGMSTLAMSGWWPIDDAAAGEGRHWSASYILLIALMWWVMMVAMMLPSAAPMILLHQRVVRHNRAAASGQSLAFTGTFASGYVLVWAAFSMLATAAQLGLDRTGVLSTSFMASRSIAVSAALLIVTGLYQLSPLKQRCLRVCRSPAAFLARTWRPGAWGALRAGMVHGAYCAGCCAALMALLFVGGVMNLAWIAALSVLVATEKLVPWGPRLGQITGIALIVGGFALLIFGLPGHP